jgi:hypothetical protein
MKKKRALEIFDIIKSLWVKKFILSKEDSINNKEKYFHTYECIDDELDKYFSDECEYSISTIINWCLYQKIYNREKSYIQEIKIINIHDNLIFHQELPENEECLKIYIAAIQQQ